MGWGGRREGGSQWGTHVHPWLIQVNVWQNPLQYCKVIGFQLIKINEKKKKKMEKRPATCSFFCPATWGPLAFLPVTLSPPPFHLVVLCCLGKGQCFFHSITASKLTRGIIPKLVRQHIFLTLILTVCDPEASSSSWRKLCHSWEFGQPFVI